MTPVFPHLTVPVPVGVSNFSPAKRVSTPEDDKSPRSVRLNTFDPGATASVTWDFRAQEYAEFDQFVQVDLNKGSKWFWLLLASGDGLVSWHLVRFQSFPTMRPAGQHQYAVEATVEIRNRLLVTYRRPVDVPTGPMLLGEDDPMWDNVLAAIPIDATNGFDDAKQLNDATVIGDVELTTSTDGSGDGRSARLGGVETGLAYGPDNGYQFPSLGEDWTAEVWFRNASTSSGTVWSLTLIQPEAGNAVMGLRVTERSVVFFAGTPLAHYEIVRYDLLNPRAWHHCIVQSRRGFIEMAVTEQGNPVGKLYTVGPSVLGVEWAGDCYLALGCLVSASFFGEGLFVSNCLTGHVDDFRFTMGLRYP